MPYVELVAILAMAQYLAFGILSGRARAQSGLRAPAMTGHDGFERMHRVQMNTLEMLVVFLPFLFLAAKYWPAWLVAGLGLVYVLGRLIYWRAYITNPSSRTLGFAMSMLPTLGLGVLAIVGIVGGMI
jgi:glutathione S-transferase